MRHSAWMLALCALVLVAFAAPHTARALPDSIVTVDRSRNAEPPKDLLDEAERERIDHLQGDAVYTLPLSPVSPNDRYVLVTAGETLGFLNLEDGSTNALDNESFASFVPIPLLGAGRFAWLDDTTLGALALSLAARSQEDAFVRLTIDSETLAIDVEPIRLPARAGLISVAPDLRHLLLALFPPEEEDTTTAAAPVRVQVARIPASGERAMAHSPAVRRLVALADSKQPEALARIWRMQAREDGTLEATPKTVDLVLWEDGGMRYVTTIAQASFGLGETWSNDAGRLAFSFAGLPDPDAARPAFDGALLSEEIYRDATGNLAPADNPILQRNNTYIVDVGSGAVSILRPSGEATPPLLAAHAWSPDNRTLLVQAWHPARIKGRTYPIYTPQFSERTAFRFYLAEGGETRETGRLESDLFSGGSFAEARAEFVSPDEIIFRASAGTDRQPYYYNRVSGELRNLADRAGSYYNVFSTNQSRQIIFTYTSFTSPPDVYRLGWDGQGLTRLTWASEELRELANLRQDPVSVTLPGGQVRRGVLIQPADAPFPPRNARIVVWQEGGPGIAMQNAWQANVEAPFGLLPGMGLALLVTPVAGRPGYGPAAFNSLVDNANFGQVDIDEQAAIVRELIRRGWTSQGKVGITGCSYGGYFTWQSIVRHPDLYTAANPQCALIDLISEWTRGYDALAPYFQGLPPYNMPDEYQRDSPIYNAARVKAAVLTFHGSADFLPVVQNENLHLQLVNRNQPARMVLFQGEGHGLAREANQRYAAQEQIAWFRSHLK